MRVDITDMKTLSAIRPRALNAYLKSRGWRKIGEYRSRADVFSYQNEQEVLVPFSEQFGDYAQIVQEVISELATVECRSELSIFNDLSISDTDVIRFRAPEAEEDGSIAIQSGVELFQQARDVLLAAACSASKPQRAYRAGKVREANEYIETVRLGQTERGSFVVTLISPVQLSLKAADQLQMWPEFNEDPYSRRVTRTLLTALEATKRAVLSANRGEGIEAFERGVKSGVSANLCEATAGLIEDGEGLDVTLSWALTRPAPVSHSRIEFSKSDASTLKEAADVLREREPRPSEFVEGYVAALARDKQATEGRVTLKTPIDGKMSSVKVDFGPSDYQVVSEAHQKRRSISLEGDLVREGQRWRLDNPRSLQVLDDEPSSDD